MSDATVIPSEATTAATLPTVDPLLDEAVQLESHGERQARAMHVQD